MKKIKRQLLSLLIVGVVLSGSACNSGETPTQWGNVSDATLWGAPATEKILQDVDEGYEDIRTDARIALTTVKGEYEAQQIIISAKDKNLKYEVSVHDLQSESGEEFPAENIEIFHEKYIEVTKNWETNGLPLGWYPDALVPVENIKAVGENVIKAGDNQGLYVRFNVPVTQAAGVYTGTFTLKIGETSTNIPITLNVLDLAVSQETHAQSHFAVNYQYFRGELEQSQTMYETYAKKLMEYRLSPGIVMEKVTTKAEDVDYYVDTAYEWMTQYGCNTVDIPYGSAVDAETGKATINKNTFALYIKAFAEKSFETGYNMFDKLITRTGTLIDEPHGHGGGVSKVQVVTDDWREVKAEVSAEIEADESITSPIKAEVVQGIRDLIDVVTTWWTEEYAPYVETFCPGFASYDTEVGRAHYANQAKRWFYGCINPRAPYPTYKIDDTLISARSVGWMQAEYDVIGNLYWTTTLYQKDINGTYYDIEDYYGDPERFGRTNGDGLLFYPGKIYGVDGPLVSMRLETIRDGIEEFELLYALKAKYTEKIEQLNENGANIHLDIEKIIHSLTQKIYNGTHVSGTSETFQAARDMMLQLCLLLENTDTYLIDFTDDGYGNATFEFLVKGDATVSFNGSAATASETLTDGTDTTYKKYVYTQSLSQDMNYFQASVQTSKGMYAYDRFLGGKVQKIDAAVMKDTDFDSKNVTPVFTKIDDASTVDASLSGALAKVTLPMGPLDKAQSFEAKGVFVENINFGVQKAILHVYYDGEDLPTFGIIAKYAAKKVAYELNSTVLQKGMNEISITFLTSDWVKDTTLEYFTFQLKSAEKVTREPERVIYIKDFILYAK
ncbi:MAG: DUF4091 domain-containing protein [Clostridia bacterium]|nr:DUF4091 domain-containing protein [Clostridia bacterium]